ncbi:unnamed protein product [Cuscuta campestris]|uniref:RNase H type-1 domain-containing protein n=1 Tax=Cuscuta campestris TaxID=132261 RepID=A0A484LJ07_9ASTE|nr:unnamed protein product [Cuscuta campestris]
MPNSDGKFYPSLLKPLCKITTRQNDLAQRWEAYPIDGNPAMSSRKTAQPNFAKAHLAGPRQRTSEERLGSTAHSAPAGSVILEATKAGLPSIGFRRQFGETSDARTPGPDPSGFWAAMRAMMLNQPMTGFHMPVTMPQPTFLSDGRREVQQNMVESAELFAQHLKNLMADSRLNPSPGGPENRELSRSQQRDKGKGPERRANKKQASRRDKETASKRCEPLKEGQGESESYASVFSRMRVPVTERLRSFPATLDGLASEWFNELPEGKIDSWEDLARRFLVHFAGNRKKKLHFSHLLSVRQRPDEPLREFLGRWKLETTRVYGADDKTRLSTFHLVLRSGDFSKRLALEKPREYSIAMAMAEDEAEAEELETNKKKEEAGRLGSSVTAVKPTPRKVTIDERPHLPVGHRFLWDIWDMWRKDDGKKSGDNRGRKPAGTQQKKRKEIGLPSDKEEEDNPRQKRIEESRMIYGGNTGGDSTEQRKKWVHSAYVGDVRSAPGPSKVAKTEPLLFGPKDLPEIPSPHRDALVVRCEINEVVIHQSYVDNGSSINIMYVKTFEELELKKELLKRVRTPLSGFTGDIIDSEGLIEVMVTFGDGEHKKTIPVEFMVVRLLGSHNLILGQPALEDLDSVTSVKYLSMKFPTDSGIGVCRGNQKLARLYYQKQTKKMDAQDLRVDSIATALLKEEESRPRAEPAEETEDVVIMEEQQEKKIKLGTNISAELRSKIIQVLRENFVVFAWSVEDMPGVSRSLITHRLAVGSDAEPIKQRRQHLSKDRRDFVKKEVDMLQAAGHVKEIKYPTWLANVVLAPKGQTFRITLRDAELRYSVVEKTILAVVNTVKKLNHYFQAHEVEVRSHQPLSIIIRNPTASNRVIKWSVYLSQYQIEMKPRAAIKAQALVDFMVECTARDNNPIPMVEQGEWWTLSTDGSSAAKACGGGVVIQSPEGFRSYHAVKFQFKVSNNEAEYEALLSGLRLILNLKAEYVRIRCDSRLVVSQIKGEFDTKEERMRLYKEAALELLKILKGYELVQIPRAENTEADVLSKLSNDSPEHISKMAHIEDLGSPRIHVQLVFVVTEEVSGWIAELIRYKKDGILPDDETTARLIKRRAPTYVVENGRLYKRSYNGTLLRCVDEARAGQIMEEVHEGVCAAHQGPFSMARRIVLQGYFWPTMVKDCAKRAKRCKVCQIFQNIPGRPGTSYHPISSSIPFAHWGIDLIRLMPRAPARAPSEVFIPTWREENYEAKENEETMAADLNFVEERREQAFLRAQNYRRQVKEYYDPKVRAREFRVGDLVLRKRESSQPTEGGKFAKSYEGPYRVTAVLRPGTYKLSTLKGRELSRHWNTHNLISFYIGSVMIGHKLRLEVGADRFLSVSTAKAFEIGAHVRAHLVHQTARLLRNLHRGGFPAERTLDRILTQRR